MRVFVVFNAHAAAGRSRKLQPEIAACMEAEGLQAVFHETRAAGHAIDLIGQSDLSGFDAVIAAGGDGTLFEVVNGLYALPRERRLPLGVLPIGTGNAFARDLVEDPGNWRQAVRLIARGRVRKIDVGEVTATGDRFYFLNIIGMGFPVDAGLTARRLKVFGNSAYTLGTLWQILRLHSYPLRMEIDGEPISEANVLVEVSNTRYTGTHFKIAPDAQMDDGLLDVTLLRSLNRRRILRLFPTIYSGGHVTFEEVYTRQARHIRLLAPEQMPLAVDGEFRGRTPVEIRCLEKDLELIA